MSVRWGNGYHRERRAHARPAMRPTEAAGLLVVFGAAVLVLLAVWAFCALLFAVMG